MNTNHIAQAYIGLDVHKDTIAVAIANPERGSEIRFYGNINNEPNIIRRTFAKLLRNYNQIFTCYEAGPCGYNLYRQLMSMNI